MVFEFVSSHLSRVAVCVPRSGSYEMSWAAELELRRPYVTAHRALPFASAAQQQAPAPRGPILSELASVNGRGGGVLLEQGAPKLQKQKTPPRRGGAPGGKLTRLRWRLPLPWRPLILPLEVVNSGRAHRYIHMHGSWN